MTATITDIAQRLKLSNSTVSKALNGYHDVSVATRELVRKTATELGYQPSAAARSLRRGRTDKIGLFLNTAITYVVDFLSGVLPGAALTAQGWGQNLLIYTITDNDPGHLLKACRAGEIDGVILFSTHYDHRTINALLEAEFPFVVMGREIADERVSYVVPDYYRGSVMAVEHLLALGHRRIAFTTRPELGTANNARLRGYLDALTSAGIAIDERLIVETRIQPFSGIEPTRQLLSLKSPPTAICAFHDLIAMDAISVAQEYGLRVPDDVSIIGFDGLRAGLITTPQITTLAQPLEYIGQRATEVVCQQIAEPDRPPVHEVVPVELIVRGSTKQYSGGV
ncbi:MAG: LacI family DNA-binding transcriptional regulator [Anaerolineae bacterium]|nr:LacI family DNA-binding transcriptional regulator [Anaerolineae bacterium]